MLGIELSPFPCVLGDQSSPSDAPSEHSDRQERKDSIMNDRVDEEGDREAVLREVESGEGREENKLEDSGVEEYEDDVIVKDLTEDEGEVGTEIPLPDMVGGEEEREQLTVGGGADGRPEPE